MKKDSTKALYQTPCVIRFSIGWTRMLCGSFNENSTSQSVDDLEDFDSNNWDY